MAVQQEIKSQLAKLLATEDLVVEHKDVPTAQFNVHTRELLLPMWEKASNHVYDMLVGHEVGHALFTPDEEMGVEVPATFLNVVEDVRIEKLMKRKYLGIAKTFYKGYHELHEKDFFEVKDENIDDLNLADRVNLYYKVGAFLDVDFTDGEIKILEMIGKCETFKEAKEAAKVLYEYCKGEVNQEQQTQKNEEGDDGGEIDVPDNSSDLETDEVDGQEVDDETPDVEPKPAEAEKEPEVQTAESLESHLQDLVRENGVENVYLEIPDLDLDKIIASNEDVHKEIDRSWKSQQDFINEHTDRKSNLFEEVDAEYNQFKRDAQKEVSYLVKEFECKKAADAYARATTSRTGVLSTEKLHTYKFNEDLFKKISVVPDGKNHGLVFILDWSGSMSNVMSDTLKQLYNLIWFCRKVSIPFEVYAFTNEWNRSVRDYASGRIDAVDCKPLYEAREYLFQVQDGFSLMNLFSSKVNAKTLEHQLLNIWRVANVFYNRHGAYYTYPPKLCLSGTPLNETLLSLHKIIPQFQKDNKLQKVQCIILTDGEAAQLPYHKEVMRHWEDEPYLGCRNVNPSSCFFRDRKVGKTYKIGYGYPEFTDMLVQNLKDNFPSTNFIGIRVLETRDAKWFIKRYYDEWKDPKAYEKVVSEWRKAKAFTIKKSAYDAYFGLSSSAFLTCICVKVLLVDNFSTLVLFNLLSFLPPIFLVFRLFNFVLRMST